MSAPWQSLYRKWRSRTFDEVVGQEHVTRTLRNALLQDRVAHAYLFAGPRGTGKTTTARLLAKAVNCLADLPQRPCGACAACESIDRSEALDVIEVDAASNRGIDDVREIQSRIRHLPEQWRRKVYIIDEVHMLTEHAFNALLKTLEEPPERVILVLATTEAHKLPPTVLSRCQRFDFRRIPVTAMLERLHQVVAHEGIAIDAAALELVARSATGSLRDALSLVDQLAAYGAEGVTATQVVGLLGGVAAQQVGDLADCLIQRDAAGALRLTTRLADTGTDPRVLGRDLVAYLRQVLLLKVGREAEGLLDVTAEELERLRGQAAAVALPDLLGALKLLGQAEVDLKATTHPTLPLELALVEAITTAGGVETRPRSAPTRPPASHSATHSPTPTRPPVVVAVPSREAAPPARPVVAPVAEPVVDELSGAPPTLEQMVALWPRVLEGVRPVDRRIEALLRNCEPVAVEGSAVVLGFHFDFHRNKVDEIRNRQVLERVISKLTGHNCHVKCQLSPKSERPSRPAPREQEADPRVRAAANIFNAKIVDMPRG